jgi:hypothetical protein
MFSIRAIPRTKPAAAPTTSGQWRRGAGDAVVAGGHGRPQPGGRFQFGQSAQPVAHPLEVTLPAAAVVAAGGMRRDRGIDRQAVAQAQQLFCSGMHVLTSW